MPCCFAIKAAWLDVPIPDKTILPSFEINHHFLMIDNLHKILDSLVRPLLMEPYYKGLVELSQIRLTKFSDKSAKTI